MRTLIVGGGGFIGLNIAEALLRAGREAVLFDRSVPEAALAELRAIGPACTVFTGDVRDAAQVAAAEAEVRDAARRLAAEAQTLAVQILALHARHTLAERFRGRT